MQQIPIVRTQEGETLDAPGEPPAGSFSKAPWHSSASEVAKAKSGRDGIAEILSRTGHPMVIGMREGQLKWTISGSLEILTR